VWNRTESDVKLATLRSLLLPIISDDVEKQKRLRHLLHAVVWSCILLAARPLDAQSVQDVCNYGSQTALNTEVEGQAATIGNTYAGTTGQLSLTGGACNWTCGTGFVITQVRLAFGLLQYNCNTTTAPGTRLPTGRGTQSEMGLSITDADYRDEADKIFRSGSTGAGDLMRVPLDIEEASKSGNVKKLTDAVDGIPGATWLKFSSTSVDNDGQGGQRVLIRVPDTQDPPRFEQWIQIAINKNTGTLGRNVDFLALQLRSDDVSSTELTTPVMAFRGFSRKSTGFEPEGPGTGSALSKCYACHPSGLRPVIPAKQGTREAGGGTAVKPEGTMLTGADLDEQLANVKDMTSILAVFGPTGYDAAENGPPLGPETWYDREDLVANGLPSRPPRAAVPACGAGLSEESQKLIVESMNCEQCHDGQTNRGILNAGTNLATIKHKVVENEEAPMPPGSTLSPKERTVLFACLRAEYAQLLQGWLTRDLLMEP
jgi:hypothetical protein